MLTGIKIVDKSSIQSALRILHTSLHIRHVVVSSLPVTRTLRSTLPTSLQQRGAHIPNDDGTYTDDDLLCIVSSSLDQFDSISTVHAATVPRIRGYYSGVGDLFSAMVLGHYVESPNAHSAVCRSTSRALTTTREILASTHAYSMGVPEEERPGTDEELDENDPERRVMRMRCRELRIIQGIDIIRSCGESEPLIGWEGFWQELNGDSSSL